MDDLNVTMTGEWDEAVRIASRYPLYVTTLRRKVLHGVSETYYRMLVNHFQRQDLNLKPLNEWYSEWKSKRGLDSRILIATGEMLSHVKQYQEDDGAFIGIRGGRTHRGSGLDVALLALIHEYGSTKRGIPARPVYRTTLRELKDKLKAIMDAAAVEAWTEVMA